MLVFDTAQFDGIGKKIIEFNASLQVEEPTTAVLKENDVARLKAIILVLKDTSHYHASSFADADFNLLTAILCSWPIQCLFPVLDLLRMMLLHPQAARWYSQEAEKGRDVLIDAIRKATAAPIVAANQLTSARVVVNCFRHSTLKAWTIKHRSEILDIFSECSNSSNRNVRFAYATLVLNYAVLLTEATDEEGQLQALSAAMENAGPQESDVEVQFRALVAIGTLIHKGSVKRIAADLDVRNIVDSALKSTASKVAEVGKDLQIELQ
ncbi:hypothetical protein O6H91_Y327400 [Diphasiastrum complanatum]|nr:hypothetical protein O6H91_Y327400 [Diphasiastrum complanatum]